VKGKKINIQELPIAKNSLFASFFAANQSDL